MKREFIFPKSTVTIWLIGIVGLLLIQNFSWKNEGYKHIITSDGLGYYQYLSNTFLTKTISSQEPDTRFFNEINQRGVNKYFVGTAVSMAPFFTLGHVIASIQDDKITGYSPPYQKSISLAGLFYLIVGLLFFRSLLRLYELTDLTITIAILVIVFGTNLLAYSVIMPSMSHIYSFFWITGFFFFLKKYTKELKANQLYWAALFLGMIVLIRPLNGIVIFAIPFLCGSWDNLKLVLVSALNLKQILIAGLILGIILFIQSYFWFLQCGKWWVWSYQGEGFHFASPYLREVLFSWRKGALIYTPVLLFSALGFLPLWKKNKFEALSAFLFVGLLVYVVSAWWNWYYGPSFGQRPFVEFYALSGILMAFFVDSVREIKVKWAARVILVLLIGLNLIQTYQYQRGIISSWDMNYEKYRYTFLKTDASYQHVLGGNNDIIQYRPIVDSVYKLSVDFEKNIEMVELGTTRGEENLNTVSDYSDKEFNFSINIPVDSNFIKKRGAYLIVDYELNDRRVSKKNEALFVIDISDSTGEKYHYQTFPVRDIPPECSNIWKTIQHTVLIKEVRNPTDRIKLYIWNREKEPFWIDNVEVQVLGID